MGSTVSHILRVKFASTDKQLDSLEDQDINSIFEILVTNYKARAYAELIYDKAIYAKPELMFKYVILVKRLEKVKDRDHENSEFIEVFKRHIRSEVANSVRRSSKMNPEFVNKIGMQIAKFVGSLLVENLIDLRTFNEILRPAYGKFPEIFSYLSNINKIRDKLKAENIMSFEHLCQKYANNPNQNSSEASR
jgi:hypothetical protein